MPKSNICWSCLKCTNINKCKWARFCFYSDLSNTTITKKEILMHTPPGTELDENKNIIYCPEYENDKLLTNKEKIINKSKLLNVAFTTLYEKIKFLNKLDEEKNGK